MAYNGKESKIRIITSDRRLITARNALIFYGYNVIRSIERAIGLLFLGFWLFRLFR
jgi:hypothetical protein